MAIVLENNKAFLHIPKTGGMWIRHVLQKNHVPFTPYVPPKDAGGFECCLLNMKKERHHLAVLPPDFTGETICVIREPVGWYKSYYLFRCHTKWTWSSARTFERNILGHRQLYDGSFYDFKDFVLSVAKQYPSGFLYWLYSAYLENSDRAIRLQNLSRKLPEIVGKELRIVPPTNTRRAELEISDYLYDLIRDYEAEAAALVGEAE